MTICSFSRVISSENIFYRQTAAKNNLLQRKIKCLVVARGKKMQKLNYIKNRKCNKAPFAALWCSLVWPRHLASHLGYKFINVWGQALSWGHPQDGVKVLICKTSPVWSCVDLHQREQLFTQVCAATHRESCVGDKRGNSYVAFSMSLHWSSISSIWRFDGAFSTSAANRLLSSSNLLFWASKSANRCVNVFQIPRGVSF